MSFWIVAGSPIKRIGGCLVISARLEPEGEMALMLFGLVGMEVWWPEQMPRGPEGCGRM